MEEKELTSEDILKRIRIWKRIFWVSGLVAVVGIILVFKFMNDSGKITRNPLKVPEVVELYSSTERVASILENSEKNLPLSSSEEKELVEPLRKILKAKALEMKKDPRIDKYYETVKKNNRVWMDALNSSLFYLMVVFMPAVFIAAISSAISDRYKIRLKKMKEGTDKKEEVKK